MIPVSLAAVAVILVSLAVFVWRAHPGHPVNRWFTSFTVAVAAWILSLALAHTGTYAEATLRLSFASASLIPATFLGLIYRYPVPNRRFPSLAPAGALLAGALFSALSILTPLIAYDARLSEAELSRQPGVLYPLFAAYFLTTFAGAAALFVTKWRHARGLDKARLQYLGSAIIFSGVGAITTNLLLPLATGRSTYAWIGPYFGLLLVAVVAHAIIRHRLMDLRLAVHRGLTLAVAMAASLAPILIVTAIVWPRLAEHFSSNDLLALLAAIAFVGLLIPFLRDLAENLLDRYVYRTHADFQRTVRGTSQLLTRVLDLKLVLSSVARAIATSVGPDGVAMYLRSHSGLARVTSEWQSEGAQSELPECAPNTVGEALAASRDPIVTEELARERDPERQRLHAELARLNWALVLPLLSENAVIGAIVVGPKRSGDPFYPHDLDLLMTLANQAGIAIKNAQLYTQVVLANEYIENIVATIESGVVAIDAEGQVTMFNRAAEALTGLAVERVRGQAVEALPAALAGLLRGTVADGQARTEPEIALPDGTRTRPVICTTSPLRDPAGTILGAVAVFSDLTPLKELEVERRRAERLAYFEILASSLAHEIKNPLVAIKTFAQLMPRRHRDERFVGEFSRVVTREMGRIERLVERLRTLSRPSDRPKQPVDVRAPVAEAVEFLRPAFEEKRITLSLSLGGEPRVVLGDHGELEGLFINLLMNAHEATPPEGNVSVDLAATDDRIVVAVADSGPGIPPELLEHVFDPFFTTRPRGSGLGLTISAGIAAAHRAKLRVANRPQGGALFTVEFPLAARVETPVHEDGSAHHVG